jgi:hypothetical protein
MINIPLHIQQGVASSWERTFAWLPVRLEEGGTVWLRPVFRRYFYPPAWFVGPAPYRWRQYSQIPASFWEIRAALAEEKTR